MPAIGRWNSIAFKVLIFMIAVGAGCWGRGELCPPAAADSKGQQNNTKIFMCSEMSI